MNATTFLQSVVVCERRIPSLATLQKRAQSFAKAGDSLSIRGDRYVILAQHTMPGYARESFFSRANTLYRRAKDAKRKANILRFMLRGY